MLRPRHANRTEHYGPRKDEPPLFSRRSVQIFIVTIMLDTGESFELELPARTGEHASKLAMGGQFYKGRKIASVVTVRPKRGGGQW